MGVRGVKNFSDDLQGSVSYTGSAHPLRDGRGRPTTFLGNAEMDYAEIVLYALEATEAGAATRTAAAPPLRMKTAPYVRGADYAVDESRGDAAAATRTFGRDARASQVHALLRPHGAPRGPAAAARVLRRDEGDDAADARGVRRDRFSVEPLRRDGERLLPRAARGRRRGARVLAAGGGPTLLHAHRPASSRGKPGREDARRETRRRTPPTRDPHPFPSSCLVRSAGRRPRPRNHPRGEPPRRWPRPALAQVNSYENASGVVIDLSALAGNPFVDLGLTVDGFRNKTSRDASAATVVRRFLLGEDGALTSENLTDAPSATDFPNINPAYRMRRHCYFWAVEWFHDGETYAYAWPRRRLPPTDDPRRSRGGLVACCPNPSTEYQRRRRGVAATRPRTVHVAAAASPRVVSNVNIRVPAAASRRDPSGEIIRAGEPRFRRL